MSDFDEYLWRHRVAKTPQLADESLVMRIKVAELKRQLEMAYEMGKQHGSAHRIKPSSPDFGDLLGGMFDKFCK